MNVDKLHALMRYAHPDDELIVDVEGMEEMVVYSIETDERDGRLIIKACRFEDLDTCQQDEVDDELPPFDKDDKDECGESCALPEKPSSKAPGSKEA